MLHRLLRDNNFVVDNDFVNEIRITQNVFRLIFSANDEFRYRYLRRKYTMSNYYGNVMASYLID